MNLFRNFPYKNFVRFHSLDHRKTTTIFMNDAIGAPLMINSFSLYGFTFNNGMKALGSVTVFPKSILGWHVKEPNDITEESLGLFHLLQPKIDILVIGIGDENVEFKRRAGAKFLHFMHKKGITVEILSTEHACCVYNFLATEGRFVAAALIPPKSYAVKYHDNIQRLEQPSPQPQESLRNVESVTLLNPSNKKV